MATGELREEKIPVPATSAALARLLQRVLALKGLVSCLINRDGVLVTRYRSIHDPLLTAEAWVEEDISTALGNLEAIHELPGAEHGATGILHAMHFISMAGFEPKVLVTPNENMYQQLTEQLGGAAATTELRYVAGLRVEVSSLLASDTFVVLGSLVGTYDLGAVRIAVRVFTERALVTEDEYEHDDGNGEDSVGSEAGSGSDQGVYGDSDPI